jgi:hypothetical protein
MAILVEVRSSLVPTAFNVGPALDGTDVSDPLELSTVSTAAASVLCADCVQLDGNSPAAADLLQNSLTGTSAAVHKDVVVLRHQAACDARLTFLRELIHSGDIAEATELSLHLPTVDRAGMPDDCQADIPFVGLGSIVSMIATPNDRMDSSGEVKSTFIQLLQQDGDETSTKWLPVKHSADHPVLMNSVAKPGLVALAGFTMDDSFHISNATTRCSTEMANTGLTCDVEMGDAGNKAQLVLNTFLSTHKAERLERRLDEMSRPDVMMGQALLPDLSNKLASAPGVSRFADISNTYAVGTKRFLAILACPSDSSNCGTQSCE